MQYYVLAVVLLLLSGYLDVLDGTLARLRKTSSALGTVYDIIADRIVEFSVIFGLFILAPNERAMACLLMLGSVLLCVTSFLVVGIFSDKKTNKNFDYSPGLIERAEAFMFFIAMILLPKYFLFLAYIFISLVCLTTIARVFEFKRYNVSED